SLSQRGTSHASQPALSARQAATEAQRGTQKRMRSPSNAGASGLGGSSKETQRAAPTPASSPAEHGSHAVVHAREQNGVPYWDFRQTRDRQSSSWRQAAPSGWGGSGATSLEASAPPGPSSEPQLEAAAMKTRTA